MGIDPGSVTTGFGVIEHVKGRIVLVEQGTIRTVKGEDLSDRLVKIFNGLSAVIARTSPEEFAVESPFAGQNPKSLIQLSHARGVIILAARIAGLPVHEYSPRSVKSAVVGYGAAEKEQVGKMIRLLVSGIGEQLLASDASDALAIAVCHAHQASFKARVRLQ